MSDRSGKPEIHAERGMDGKISIRISHCTVSFQGSSLEVLGEPQFIGISRKELSPPFGSLQYNAINIADDAYCSRVTLSECDIQNSHPNKDIDFRATSLSFEKCKAVDGDNHISFVWGSSQNMRVDWDVDGLADGSLKIDRERSLVIAKNISIGWRFPDGNQLRVVIKDAAGATFSIPFGSDFHIKKGKVKSIEYTHQNISIHLRNESSIETLEAKTCQWKFNRVQSRSDECSIVLADSGHESILSYLNHDGSIEINTRIEKFVCDTCDFSKIELEFLGTSSLDLDMNSFKSIATVWNPNTITYRGFCPADPKGATHRANISAARQFFCEMKTYFSGKGDSITAGDFHAAEMVAHRRYLQLQKNPSCSDRVDRFILSVSRHSSNFGQSLFRAIVSYGLLGFLFSIILLCLMGDTCARCFADWHVSRSFDCSFFGVFLLNVWSPLNFKLTDIIPSGLGPSPNSFWAMFVWMMWKIIGSFLIFQIIASSRRFIRKW